MFSAKYSVALVLALFAALSHGKVVNVKNGRTTALEVSVGDTQHIIVGNGFVPITLPDEWTGVLSAVPEGSEVVDGPRTKVELSLGAAGDSYSISLLDGFNLGAKVIPNGSLTKCSAVVCNANILNACPVEKQVTNSLAEVVACHNAPLLMSSRCPLAVADVATPANVKTCADAISYLVIFNN